MVFKKLKDMTSSIVAVEKSVSAGEEEYIEVDVGGSVGTGTSPVSGKMGIVIENIAEFGDTEKVLRFLREGNIVLLKVKALKDKDLGELKRVVDWLLLVPDTVTVRR
jgi:SepF-like predicted cell division protein (DUF552 family)